MRYGWTGPGGYESDGRGQMEADDRAGLDVTDHDAVLSRAQAWLAEEFPEQADEFLVADGGPDSGISVYAFADDETDADD